MSPPPALHQVQIHVERPDRTTYSFYYSLPAPNDLDYHLPILKRFLTVLGVPEPDLDRLVLAEPDDLK